MFITFEGIDGSGKSTQIKKLKERLEQQGAVVKVFRDPGGPEVSERVREILLNPDYAMDSVTELLLFSAARSQLMAENVLPSLQEGAVVILDRFYDSTTAYQGYGRESVSLDEVQKMNILASHNRAPDLTIYMKIPLQEAKNRMADDKDRMEQAGDHFFGKVVKGFNRLADNEERIVTVDATQPENQVHDRIWQNVQQHFSRR